MLNLSAVPDINRNEILARFVLYTGHVRASDNTVRPDAFMPHPHNVLSVTRHREATDEELWNEGRRVSTMLRLTLHGRADVSVSEFTAEDLRVVPDPLQENPNHANVVDWAAEKPAQKIKALQIASKSKYVPAP